MFGSVVAVGLKQNRTHGFGDMHLKELAKLTISNYNQEHHASSFRRKFVLKWEIMVKSQLCLGLTCLLGDQLALGSSKKSTSGETT